MRIALCQLQIEFESKKINEERAMTFVKNAAHNGVKLVLFPEMSLTGFSMNVAITAEDNHESVKRFQEIAKEYSICIGLGWVLKEKEQSKAENHYTIIDSNGKILNDCIKIHPFSYAGEDQFFKSGNSISHFYIDDYCMSSFICYDLRFPEIFQMASKEAHIIIVPANWPAKRSQNWKCLLQARAIENQVYILGINCVGNQKDIYYSGDSCIIDPNGEIKEMLSNQEGLIIYDLADDTERFRSAFPVKQDRRNYAKDIVMK